MKRFLSLFVVLIFTCSLIFAAQSNAVTGKIRFNNKTFVLKFAKCIEEHNMCTNEYYLPNEKDWGWSELITVHYYGKVPNHKYYAQYLVNNTKYAEILDASDEYTIFTSLHPYMMQEKRHVEQAIFKAENCKYDSGIVLIQYGERFPYNTREEGAKTDILLRANQSKITEKFKHTQIPKIVKDNFQKW